METDIKDAVKKALDDLPNNEAVEVLEFIGYLRWRRQKVDQSWFQSEEWQTRYQDAKADLNEGRYQDFNYIKDLLTHLKNQPETEK